MTINKSLRTIKFILPVVAIVIATALFAFAKKGIDNHPTKPTQVWLKYDCSTGLPDLNGTTNISFTDNSNLCPGPDSNPKCMERFADISELEEIPEHPGFYQPSQGSTAQVTYYCD